jgi:hypothetical protein
MGLAGALLLLLAAAIAASRGLPIWECDLACSGTAAWGRPGGIEISWVAAGLLALAGGLALVTRTRAAGTVLGWVAAGGCLVYLGLAAALDIRCDHCLATHLPALAGAVLLFAAAPIRVAAVALVAGLLAGGALAGVLHLGRPTPIPVVAAPPPTVDLVAAVDAGRTWGTAGPVVEVGLDPHCPRCAALAAELPGLPARTTIRFIGNDPEGRELAELLTAAAADGAPALRSWMGLLLGAPEGTGWPELRPRVAEVLDPAPVEARAAGVAAIVQADRGHLAGLLGRDPARPLPTPVVVVTGNDGRALVLRGATIETLRAAIGR